MHNYTSYLSTFSLEMYSTLFLYPEIIGNVLSSYTLNTNPTSYIHMIWKHLDESKCYKIYSS